MSAPQVEWQNLFPGLARDGVPVVLPFYADEPTTLQKVVVGPLIMLFIFFVMVAYLTLWAGPPITAWALVAKSSSLEWVAPLAWATLVTHGYIVFWCLRRLVQIPRLITDTPTAKIRSAPQGRVELIGTALPLGPLPQTCSGCGEPALFKFVQTGKGRTLDTNVAFMLQDETGQCVVNGNGGNELGDFRGIGKPGCGHVPFGTRLYVFGHFWTDDRGALYERIGTKLTDLVSAERGLSGGDFLVLPEANRDTRKVQGLYRRKTLYLLLWEIPILAATVIVCGPYL